MTNEDFFFSLSIVNYPLSIASNQDPLSIIHYKLQIASNQVSWHVIGLCHTTSFLQQ